jgi:cytochrome P450
MSYTIGRSDAAAHAAAAEFEQVTAEMNDDLAGVLRRLRAAPQDNLLCRLAHAEVDGERLTQEEILGFCQWLDEGAGLIAIRCGGS